MRGVTYGTFAPDECGNQFRDPDTVESDFALMAKLGANAVRTYTPPPIWMLDAALRHGLRVMVGLPWEQHVTFLDGRGVTQRIERSIRDAVAGCDGHPAVLMYAIGNEIPAAVTRWQGRRRVEDYIERLYRGAKAEDPQGLVTYVSFPTTEYLCLPFLDVVAYNVYLETQDRLAAYIARLHNQGGDRPLLMSELGLESRGNGEAKQARVLDWQIRTTFAAGCAGAFVFSFTDEWWRGGFEVEDWDFGLVNRERQPKPAFEAVQQAFQDVPFSKDVARPRISVVVCTYNGSATIRDCLDGLRLLDYPNYEVIVVDDGSTDATSAIASEYDVKLIRTGNNGLSHARNLGLRAATGEIVAYTDDDARPDTNWLTYLAQAYHDDSYAAFGGPNIAPAGDGIIAECVSNAPGGPVHVLLSDVEAEHIPGCNMSFRKSALEEVGGFDTQFRTAGDDVDICWRLQERGFRLGFVPAAFVWHHSRNSVRTYWKQQTGYGKAEAMLERKWPEKYNGLGHLSWAGRVYANRLEQAFTRRRGLIHHGVWGAGLFQSLYQPARGASWSLPQMPEWYLAMGALALLSFLGMGWAPLLLAVPVLIIVLGLSFVQCWFAAAEAVYPSAAHSGFKQTRLRLLNAMLHLAQPLARLNGRARSGLTPWRHRGTGWVPPLTREDEIWSETWQAPEQRLHFLEAKARAAGAVPRRGTECDEYDMWIRTGVLAGVRSLLCIEEHGGGRQYIRVRTWPTYSPFALGFAIFFGVIAALAFRSGALVVGGVLGAAAGLILFYSVRQCGVAMGVLRRTLSDSGATWGTTRAEG